MVYFLHFSFNMSITFLLKHSVYFHVIWTDNGSTLLEANTRRQERKYPMIKVLQCCILKLSLHSVNSVPIVYRIGNMQSAILLSFFASSSLPPCGLQSTHPPMLCYISPYIVFNVYGGALESGVQGDRLAARLTLTQHTLV